MTALAPALTARTRIGSATLTNVAFIVLGSLVVAGLAQLHISLLPFSPVPITGQTLGVLLVGGALGAWRGAAALALYLVEGLIGLPFYADGQNMSQLLDQFGTVTAIPSFGYIIGFVVAAALVGFFAERGWDRVPGSAIGAMLLGEIVIFAIGVTWLANAVNLPAAAAMEAGLYPFVVGDVLKLLIAAGLLPAAWKLLGENRSS
jgi:biotin transport system substrate-specific component